MMVKQVPACMKIKDVLAEMKNQFHHSILRLENCLEYSLGVGSL